MTEMIPENGRKAYLFPLTLRFRTVFLLMLSYASLMACGTVELPKADTLQYYVSQRGNDSDNGTEKAPFKSLEKALEAILKARKDDLSKKARITIAGGRYPFERTIFLGKQHSNIRITAREGEVVSFHGGISFPVSALVDTLMLPTPYVKGRKVYMIDLKKSGVSDYGTLRNVGFARPYGPSWGELFINNKPLRLARWPNDDKIPMGEVLEEGSVPRFEDFSGKGGLIRYDSTRIDQWSQEDDVWISGYFKHGYADDMVRLAEINTDNKTMKTASPTLYGFGSGKPWNTWYGVNILAELDAEGEYYIDKKEGKLYFIHPPKIESIDFSLLETPFFQIQHTENLSLEGMVFEVSRGIGIAMDNTQNVTVEDCTFRNLGSLGVTVGKGIKPFKGYPHEGTGELVSGVVGSLQQHLYANTTTNRQGGKNNRIVNCTFYQLGAGGVSLGGGDRPTLEKGNNSVENCLMHNLNRIEKSYRAPIHITGVGNRIAHCEIYDAPSMAILLHGNDHVIEFNNIHDVCKEVDDQGALYYGRDPSERGHRVRYNYFHDIADEHRTTAVYHDDGACGMKVFGNIFFRAGSLPVLIGGGMDNPYTNNIFIDCGLAVHVDNRLQNWSKATLDEGGIFDRRLKAVNYKNPPYSKAYPNLVNYWEDNPSLPKRNTFSKNIFYKVEKVHNGKAEWLPFLDDNWIADENPGFTDYAEENFELVPDAAAFEKVSGFEPIPFDKIGIQNNGRSGKK